MTEYIIIALLAVLLVLLIILLIRLSAGRNNGAELQQSVSESVQSSVKNLGEMLTSAQKSVAEAQLGQLRQLEGRIGSLESVNEQKLEQLRQTVDTRLNLIRTENNNELERIRATVDERLQKTLEDNMSRSFKAVSERLDAVFRGLGELQGMADNVGDLKRILSNVKTRGILGEIQLGAILSDILAPEQYGENVRVDPSRSNAVEFAVKLPGEGGSPVWLPIDSKFPGDTYSAYRDACDSGDRARIAEAMKSLEATVKSEAKDISEKYISVPYTTNFAVMFLPFEGLYAEVVNNTALVETIQKKYRVNIAGPSTMAALLNSLQMGFRTLAIQKRSEEVWQTLGAVKTEFESFEKNLNAVKANLNKADMELEKLVGTRTRAINRRLNGVQALDETSAAELLGLDSGE